jgi:hypothetical protein
MGGTRIPPDELGYTWNQDNTNTYNWPNRLFPPADRMFYRVQVYP